MNLLWFANSGVLAAIALREFTHGSRRWGAFAVFVSLMSLVQGLAS